MIEEYTLEEILQYSNPRISQRHKKRLFDMLNFIRINSKEKIGTIIILGYDNSMKEYVKPMDVDVFKNSPLSIYDKNIEQKMYEAMHYDGAILVSKKGIAQNSGMYLRADPVEVLEKKGIPNERDLSDRFGFKKKIGTRHCSAKASSFLMQDTTVFVLSEEYGTIRIFEKGDTIYSPIKEEIEIKRMKKTG